jgi:hypothetical protein
LTPFVVGNERCNDENDGEKSKENFHGASRIASMRKWRIAARDGLQKQARGVSISILRQGCSTQVGLRDTLEPDPDNTGVGSFRSQAFFFLDSQHECSCFMNFKNKGNSCSILLPPLRAVPHLNHLHAQRQSHFAGRLQEVAPCLRAGQLDCCFAA